MSTPRTPPTAGLPMRLGRHHFAYMRALVEGVDQVQSARRYLGITHAHAANGAHQQLVMLFRAQARRLGSRDWRLIGPRIGLSAPEPQVSAPETPALGTAKTPTLEDWIAQSASDLGDFGLQEQLALYEAEFGCQPPGGGTPTQDRRQSVRAQRRRGLRARQIALIEQLERELAVDPRPEDPVDAWVAEDTATRLSGAGFFTLAQLGAAMLDSRRWYARARGIGQQKAERLEGFLRSLLPSVFIRGDAAPRHPMGADEWGLPATGPQRAADPPSPSGQLVEVVPSMPVTRLADVPAARGTSASNDAQAVDTWVCSRAGSDATHKSYRREATRLLLWLRKERGGLTLADMSAEECRDYLAFLKSVPDHWISRKGTRPGERGWAPFRGQLTLRSQQHAAIVVAGLFAWLVNARYLSHNPWALVNMKTGDDPTVSMLDSKALSEVAMVELLDAARRKPPSPARDRFIFLLLFVEAVGLRSAEMLAARLGQFKRLPEGWALQVHGKGAKNRIVMIPNQAVLALEEYLQSRGIASISDADPELPLVGSTLDAQSGIGYQALYMSVRAWVQRCLDHASLDSSERLKVAQASMHWLRHTFGTRAVARDVPLDVIQAQMGHASINTTMSIYGRAPVARRAAELEKAFGGRKVS